MLTGPEVLDLAREAIVLLLRLAAPIMAGALIVGFIIALLQALTQVQEMTLVFVPKIIAVFVILLVMLPALGQMLNTFMQGIMVRIAGG